MMENPFRVTVQERRRELGLTQADLALRMGTHKTTVVRIESPRNLPPTRLWAKMAEALEWGLDDLQRRVASQWLRQYGGPSREDEAPGYPKPVLVTSELAELDGRLDFDIGRLPHPWWSMAMSTWRSQLRGSLALIDQLIDAQRVQVQTLRSFFQVMVVEPPRRLRIEKRRRGRKLLKKVEKSR